jgi:predicted RNase H-like nuclease (RuvC/YqgF family)
VAPRTGQLDEISEAIGRMSGKVESLDRYTHEREHGINNLSQKLDGVGAKISRESPLEERIRVDSSKKNEARVALLENLSQQQAGAKNLVTWFLQSPLIGWIAAAILFFIGWWKSVPR